MSLLLPAGRAALAEDMGMTLLPRAHPIMTLCCWRCALSCALCDKRGVNDQNAMMWCQLVAHCQAFCTQGQSHAA